MTDTNVEPANEPAAPSVPEPAPAPTPSAEQLAASLRRHRVWLVILSVLVGLLCFVIVGTIALAVISYTSVAGEMITDMSVSTKDAESQVRAAFGDRLDRVEVREVELDFGDYVPFPLAFMDGGVEKTTYVEYLLKGSDVVVAGTTNGMFGDDLGSSGMLPTQGTLANRMTDEQFDKLLAAYAAETKEPLGAVRRYNDRDYAMETGVTVPEEILVGATSYKTKELWKATQGRIIKGDKLDMNSDLGMGKAFIFREDPETGEFTFLGTESAEEIF